MFEKVEFDLKSCELLLYILYKFSQNKTLFTKEKFIEFFFKSKNHIKDGLEVLYDTIDSGDMMQDVNWKIIMKNMPYIKYINHTQKTLRCNLRMRKDFNFFMDNIQYSSPDILLKSSLTLLLDDIKKAPEGLSLKSPITDHAARVYEYLKKSRSIKDGNDSDSEDENKYDTDFWDHDSGLALYYYLNLVLKVSPEKAKRLAEAVANKDAESLGFYRQLIEYEPGKFRWEKTSTIPELSIECLILHEVDGLEVKRVRKVYDSSRLHAWKMVQKDEDSINELA